MKDHKTLVKTTLAALAAAWLMAMPAAAGVIDVPIEPAPDGAAGWRVKEWKGDADFKVEKTEIGNALHLKSNSTSTAVYREFKFDVKEFPVLRWKWRVVALPRDGDVRSSSTDDQAAQIYVIFPRFPAKINSRLVGYIWDSNAPAGSKLESKKTSLTRYVVLRSGADGLGQWHAEERNVYEDYKELFGEEPPEAGGVTVMIDSDDTKGSAESFIGAITLSGPAK